MTQRLNVEDEHPLYRFAITNGLVKKPTIFVNRNDKKILGSGDCDAYVFFPEVKIVKGRPVWMIKDLGRKKVRIPKQLISYNGMWLIQAFEQGEPDSAITVDQIVIKDGEEKLLMLPKGEFRVRAINKDGHVLKAVTLKI